MTDEHALRSGVLGSRDELPGLVFADWLDERGRHEAMAWRTIWLGIKSYGSGRGYGSGIGGRDGNGSGGVGGDGSGGGSGGSGSGSGSVGYGYGNGDGYGEYLYTKLE